MYLAIGTLLSSFSEKKAKITIIFILSPNFFDKMKSQEYDYNYKFMYISFIYIFFCLLNLLPDFLTNWTNLNYLLYSLTLPLSYVYKYNKLQSNIKKKETGMYVHVSVRKHFNTKFAERK